MSKQFVEEMVRNEEWKATLQLLIATNGGEIYKKHVIDMFPEAHKHFDRGGWMRVLALPYTVVQPRLSRVQHHAEL